MIVYVPTEHASNWCLLWLLVIPLAYFIGWCQTTIQEIGFRKFLRRFICWIFLIPLLVMDLSAFLPLLTGPWILHFVPFTIDLGAFFGWWIVTVSIHAILIAGVLDLQPFTATTTKPSAKRWESSYNSCGGYVDKNYGSNSRWTSK